MNSNRKRTIIAGSIYFIGTVAGVLSIAPAVDASDYLLKAAPNANQVLLICIISVYHDNSISRFCDNVISDIKKTYGKFGSWIS